MKHIAQGVKISFVHLRKPGEVVRHNEPKGSPAIDFVMFGVVLPSGSAIGTVVWISGPGGAGRSGEKVSNSGSAEVEAQMELPN